MSPNGSDDNAGGKASPLRTIGAALSKAMFPGMRVFVCEGTYSENVRVTSEVLIYGGLSCANWSYNGKHPLILGGASAPALTVAKAKDVILEDIDVEGANATTSGGSSIAGFISESTVTLRRAALTARSGRSGVRGGDGGGARNPAPDGNPGGRESDPGSGRGAEQPNPQCPASKGGAGGAGSIGNAPGGQPAITPSNPANGAGGANGSNGTGVGGANAPGGGLGLGATRPGVLTVSGWQPESGRNGGDGGFGQGGGGQGGSTYQAGGDSFVSYGGSGAAGGCGGKGGSGGTAGGSSIALAIFNSKVSIEASLLSAANAGQGGDGGKGQIGQAGGKGNSAGYYGGDGGAGGSGGGGGGGAGGISVGILWGGTTPPILNGNQVERGTTFEGITVASEAGPGGKAGAATEAVVAGGGLGAAGTPGIAGVASAILHVE